MLGARDRGAKSLMLHSHKPNIENSRQKAEDRAETIMSRHACPVDLNKLLVEQKKYSYNPRTTEEIINENFRSNQPRDVTQLGHLIKFPDLTGQQFHA